MHRARDRFRGCEFIEFAKTHDAGKTGLNRGNCVGETEIYLIPIPILHCSKRTSWKTLLHIHLLHEHPLQVVRVSVQAERLCQTKRVAALLAVSKIQSALTKKEHNPFEFIQLTNKYVQVTKPCKIEGEKSATSIHSKPEYLTTNNETFKQIFTPAVQPSLLTRPFPSLCAPRTKS